MQRKILLKKHYLITLEVRIQREIIGIERSRDIRDDFDYLSIRIIVNAPN